VTPPARDPSLEQRLDDACADVSGGSCGVTDTGAVTAKVEWDSPSSVRIEVTDRATGRRAERTLDFRSTDREGDRWQAAGLVVATLARSVHEDKAAEVAPKPEPRPATVWISAGTLVGNGLAPGPPRVGAWVRAAYHLPVTALWVGGGLSQAFAAGGANGIDPTWTTLSAAIGTTFTAHSVDADFRPSLELLAQRQFVRLERPDPGPRAKEEPDGERWLPGVAASFEAVWPVRSPVAVAAGFGGSLLTGGTAVRVEGEKYASFPAASFAVTLGLRLSPW
jgi:hypothetical protein